MAGGYLPYGLAPSGDLTAYQPTLRERATDWLRQKLFTDDRAGQDKANRLMDVASVTPFGFALDTYDAGRAGGRGDYGAAGTIAAMALIPGFHGSPSKTLKKVSARPMKRQFDNATSQFGAFFAPDIEGAKKYAGEAGQIYKANIDLNNPYEMDWSEFRRWQNISKTPRGKWLEPSKWEGRANALKEASPEFVNGLKAMGHDGIIIRKPDGTIVEIASFSDVPVDRIEGNR